MHFFCPTLTPPGMAERVLSPDGFLLPGSLGKTCTFSKQLQLASLGQDCSYNPYCSTSVLKHLHIPSHPSTHPFTLIYALLYFSCSPPLLHPLQIPLTSTLTPHPPHNPYVCSPLPLPTLLFLCVTSTHLHSHFLVICTYIYIMLCSLPVSSSQYDWCSRK